MAKRPLSIRIRSYQVGFGDCSLLTFDYKSDGSDSRHVLIDFGSTARPKSAPSLDDVAARIKEDCGGSLNAVVATHRHKDHISGFATRKGGGPGAVIASCKPKVVLQPWTEDPRAASDARVPTHYGKSKGFVQGLASMQGLAETVARSARSLPNLSKSMQSHLAFLGENNISNRSAVENLIRMGKKSKGRFLYFGCEKDMDLSRDMDLEGVDIRVLGPPTLEQTTAIRKQRSRDNDEFWHLRAAATSFWDHRVDQRPFWQFQNSALQAVAGGKGGKKGASVLFPRADVWSHTPAWSRWFVERLERESADSLLQIVRTLDDAMNNTSVILLVKVGSMKLLFPGDAQVENWGYALGQAKVRRLLGGTNVYKVGHHGSLNATPKTLWSLFENRGSERKAGRLHTLNSTMGGKHGSTSKRTEVPRRTLVHALKDESHYLTTQSIKSKKTFWRDTEVDVRRKQVKQP